MGREKVGANLLGKLHQLGGMLAFRRARAQNLSQMGIMRGGVKRNSVVFDFCRDQGPCRFRRRQ